MRVSLRVRIGAPLLISKIKLLKWSRPPGLPPRLSISRRAPLEYTLKFASPHLEASGRNRSKHGAESLPFFPRPVWERAWARKRPSSFWKLDGTPIVILSLRRIAACPQVTDIIVATRADEVARLKERIAREKFKQQVRVVKGGDSASGFGGSGAARGGATNTKIVLVHDAVRPFVTPEQIARVIEEARRCEAAILGIPSDGHGQGSKARQLAGGRGVDYGDDAARARGAGRRRRRRFQQDF